MSFSDFYIKMTKLLIKIYHLKQGLPAYFMFLAFKSCYATVTKQWACFYLNVFLTVVLLIFTCGHMLLFKFFSNSGHVFFKITK